MTRAADAFAAQISRAIPGSWYKRLTDGRRVRRNGSAGASSYERLLSWRVESGWCGHRKGRGTPRPPVSSAGLLLLAGLVDDDHLIEGVQAGSERGRGRCRATISATGAGDCGPPASKPRNV